MPSFRIVACKSKTMKKTFSISITFLFFFIANVSFATPKFNSLSGADAVIFLDFDGHFVEGTLWNNGQDFNCKAANLTDDQISKIFQSVAEDFRPFKINITTDSISFLNAPINRRIRIIVTPTSQWKNGVNGISFIGSFLWGDDTPGFVFSDKLSNNTKYIAECCSHESGHALGLAHQSNYNNSCEMTETYHSGYGNGETSWAPIMGNSYQKNMTGWNNGATPYGCNNTQDNLALIAGVNNIAFREDDYSDELDNNSVGISSDDFNIKGMINTTRDKDVFKLDINRETVLQIKGVPYWEGNENNNADLDMSILLYNEAHALVKTIDPLESMSVAFETYLKAGTYYMVVDGVGNRFAGEYGSLGSYSITGTFKTPNAPKVVLSGKTQFGKDMLEWKTTSYDETISEQLEFSTDGIVFTDINVLATIVKSTSLSSGVYQNRYYRVKSTLSSDKTVYSNILLLSNTGFEVATLVQSQLVVHANQMYTYILSDMNGRIVSKGNGSMGLNRTNISSLSSGAYIITLIVEGQKTSRRILKQ